MRAVLPCGGLIPDVFLGLTCHCGLSAGLTRRWWQALKRSEAPLCVSWRQHLLFFSETRAQRLARTHMIHIICAPTKAIEVCEALYTEGLLSRGEATAVQERILVQTDAHGHWRAA
jgi:hypothetical protein